MNMRGTLEGDFEHHVNLLLEDGRHIQVSKSQVTSLGKGSYELNPGATFHTFPEKKKTA